MSKVLGIIGSLGIDKNLEFADCRKSNLKTRYGVVPAVRGTLSGVPAVQITRAGGRDLAAHSINHRANIAALASAGVTHILSTAMVGGLDLKFAVGDLVLVDQFLDFARHHELTFFTDHKFRDMDFTDPYCPQMRNNLLTASLDLNIPLVPNGCYVSVDGPRFETRAEVSMYRMLGGDVVGMTGLPECVMAREAGMCFASIAGVVNPAAGLSNEPVEAQNLLEHRSRIIDQIALLFRRYATMIADQCESSVEAYCCNRNFGG